MHSDYENSMYMFVCLLLLIFFFALLIFFLLIFFFQIFLQSNFFPLKYPVPPLINPLRVPVLLPPFLLLLPSLPSAPAPTV